MKKTKHTRNLLIGIIILIVGVIITRGLTYAKYVSESVLNYYLNSKGFYFTSDNLSTETSNITDTSWDGGSVYFNLKNSSDSGLATSYEITYQITCEVEGENKACKLNGTDYNIYNGKLVPIEGCSNYTDDGVDVTSYSEESCTSNNYTWESKPTYSNLYFNIIDTTGASVDTATVTITAKALSPYEKTLTGKYVLTKDKSDIGSLDLTYENKTDYSNLIITNSYNEDKCAKLTWDASKLALDNTETDIVSSSTDENDNVNEISFNISGMDSKNYIFYTLDTTKTYSKTDFNLVEIDCQ